MNDQITINREVAAKVLQIVDAGLVSGVGIPEPGKLCVEAAVCLALGLPHGDEPPCVSPALRSLKIRLNDASRSSELARAKGLRRLAIAQLGSAGALDEKEFVHRIADYTIRTTVPRAMRIVASVLKNAEHRDAMIKAASRCESEGTREAAWEAKNAAAAAAADAAAAAAYAYAADDAAAADAAAAAAAAYAHAYAAYAADDAAAAAADAADAYAAAAAAYAYAAAADAYAYAADDAAAAAADAAADAYAYADAAAAYAADDAAAAADAAAAYAADAAAAAADAAAAYAYAYAYAAYAKRDVELSTFAEAVVQILIEMNAPGCEFLDLAPVSNQRGEQ